MQSSRKSLGTSEIFLLAGTTDEQKETNVRDADRWRALVEYLQSARASDEAGLDVLESYTAKL